MWRASQAAVAAGFLLLLPAYGVRSIGAAEFGFFAMSAALLSVVISTEWAFTSALVPAVANGGGEAAVRTAQTVQLWLATTVAAVTSWLAALQPSVQRAESVAILGATGSLVVATSAVSTLAYAGFKFRVVALATATGAAASTVVLVLTTPGLGVVGLALAQSTYLLVPRLALVSWSRSVPGFRLWHPTSSRPELLRLATAVLPLLALGAAMQLVVATDLLVVSALAGTASTAAYRVGSVLPTQVSTLLYQLYDVALPRLAALDREEQIRLTASRSRMFSLFAAASLGGLAGERELVSEALFARRSALVELVLVLFAAAWAANTVIHGWSILLVVRGLQKRLAAAVAAQALTNTVLTVVLVLATGAAGAALATALAVALGDLVALPLLLRASGISAVRRIALDAATLTATALLVVAGAFVLQRVVPTAQYRLPVEGAVMLCVVAGLLGRRPGRARQL